MEDYRGQHFVANTLRGDVSNMRRESGLEQMAPYHLVQAERRKSAVGFSDRGGIAGDFPICVVPLIHRISAKIAACGATSAKSRQHHPTTAPTAAPSPRKNQLGKARPQHPAFVIESDASIVVLLIFAYVLGH